MSEFLAEALVVVRPDTTKFRAQLEAQLAAIKVAPISVPIIAAGAGLAAAAAATGGLVAAQKIAQTEALGLAGTEKVLSSRYAEQAVILKGLTASTLQQAGSQAALDLANKKASSGLLGANTAAAKLNAGLLGLRTALGSTAVIGLGALALGAIVAGKALSASVRNFAAFQAELSTFRVVAGATADEMRAISEQATRLGRDVRLPGVSAADAAVAMTELAKAGLSVQEAMQGAEGVLQLATAAQISNGEAALIAANALNSFGLAGDQAERVADTLANAANAAQGSISDFGLALRQSSAVARQVGLSLQDTTAILSLFAKNGLQGSDAGTSLRVALIKLVAPTDKAKEAIAELSKRGFELRDAFGNVRADVFAQFGEATKNFTPAMRDATAALIFGQDAIRAVAIGAREGADGLKIMQFEIDQQGTAAEVAAARTEGLAGALSGLQSAGEGLSITFGRLLEGPIGETAKNFAVIASSIDRLISKSEELAASTPGPQGKLQRLSNTVKDIGKGILIPGEGFKRLALILDGAGRAAEEADKKFQDLNDQMQRLQEVRVLAAKGGLLGIADQLTPQIEGLREQIVALERESQGLSAVANPLRDAVVLLKEIQDIRIELDLPTEGINRFIRSLEHQAAVSEHTEGNIQRLRDDVVDLGKSSQNSAGGVDALTRALNNLGRQASAAQAELLRLQTEGGTPQQQIAVLGGLRKTQEEIIAKIKEDGNQAGDASAITEARNKILSFDSQIESLQNELAADAKALATAAEKAQKERQDAFERVLAAQLLPKERLLARAGGTEGVGDDIKFREVIIKILKGQIDQIQKTLGNTLEARKLIGAIQDRILSEVLKLKADQRTFRQNLRAALEEKLENAQRGTELDIELADINENTKRRIALRQRLIAQLKKEAKVLHLQGNALKENRNERARIRAEIEAILKEEKGGEDTRKKAAEFFFEQLQAQQGFASNLLGNLITGPTAGLVGVPAPTTPDRGVQTAAAVQEGKRAGGPTGGQAQTTNDILLRILQQLRTLNGSYDAPEAINQKKTGSSSMDYAAM